MTNENRTVAELLNDVDADAIVRDGVLYYEQTIERVFGPALAELHSKLESAEFWQGVYPEGWTAQKVADEMHDYRMILKGLPELYMHITGGACSKENTDKSVIISLHDDRVTELCEEETEGLEAKIAGLNEHIAALNALLVQQERELAEAGQVLAAEVQNCVQLMEQNANLSRAVAELTETKADFYRSGVADGRAQKDAELAGSSMNDTLISSAILACKAVREVHVMAGNNAAARGATNCIEAIGMLRPKKESGK